MKEILEVSEIEFLHASTEFLSALKRGDADLEKYFRKAQTPGDLQYFVAWTMFYLTLKNHGIEARHFGLNEPSSGELYEFFEDKLLRQNIDPIKTINDDGYASRVAQAISESLLNPN